MGTDYSEYWSLISELLLSIGIDWSILTDNMNEEWCEHNNPAPSTIGRWWQFIFFTRIQILLSLFSCWRAVCHLNQTLITIKHARSLSNIYNGLCGVDYFTYILFISYWKKANMRWLIHCLHKICKSHFTDSRKNCVSRYNFLITFWMSQSKLSVHNCSFKCVFKWNNQNEIVRCFIVVLFALVSLHQIKLARKQWVQLHFEQTDTYKANVNARVYYFVGMAKFIH